MKNKILICVCILAVFSEVNGSFIDALNDFTVTIQNLIQTIFSTPGTCKKKEPTPVTVQTLTNVESERVMFDPVVHVLGISEDTVQVLVSDNATKEQIKQRNQLVVYDKHCDRYELVNQKNGKKWSAGKFAQYSIADLRQKTKNINHGPSRISVIEALDNPEGKDKNGAWFRPLFDVGALQMDPANADAVFQVASNFNGLEGGGATRLFNYMQPGMYVQGEAASLSAAAAALLRMFFIIEHKGMLYKQDSSLTGYKAINFLSEVPEIPIKYGYPVGTVDSVFGRLSEQEADAYVQKIKIGFHENVSVTSGLGPIRKPADFGNGTMKAIVQHNNSAPTINQVFTAALNIGGVMQNAAALKAAQIILDAAYEGTIRAAAYKNKKKVYLTLIGGGVFYNKLPWIQDALIKALDTAKNYGLDITIVAYSLQPFPLPEQNAFRDVFKKRAAESGGTYAQYSWAGKA